MVRQPSGAPGGMFSLGWGSQWVRGVLTLGTEKTLLMLSNPFLLKMVRKGAGEVN